MSEYYVRFTDDDGTEHAYPLTGEQVDQLSAGNPVVAAAEWVDDPAAERVRRAGETRRGTRPLRLYCADCAGTARGGRRPSPCLKGRDKAPAIGEVWITDEGLLVSADRRAVGDEWTNYVGQVKEQARRAGFIKWAPWPTDVARLIVGADVPRGAPWWRELVVCPVHGPRVDPRPAIARNLASHRGGTIEVHLPGCTS